MANISQESLRLLNEQIRHEILNSQKYRYIGSYLKKIGLDNIGEHFLSQMNDELNHAKLITDYINDRDEKVITNTIPSGDVEFNSLTGLADAYLSIEQQTTTKLSVITNQALSEGDYILFEFMLTMQKEQREEEEKSLSYKNKADMADNDMKTYLIWDANFSI